MKMRLSSVRMCCSEMKQPSVVSQVQITSSQYENKVTGTQTSHDISRLILQVRVRATSLASELG